jgi:hypothetical protein
MDVAPFAPLRRPSPLVGCAGMYGSPAPMDDVVESLPGDDLRSLLARSLAVPRDDGSRSEDGVSGAMVELGGERRPE